MAAAFSHLQQTGNSDTDEIANYDNGHKRVWAASFGPGTETAGFEMGLHYFINSYLTGGINWFNLSDKQHHSVII